MLHGTVFQKTTKRLKKKKKNLRKTKQNTGSRGGNLDKRWWSLTGTEATDSSGTPDSESGWGGAAFGVFCRL